MAITVICMFIFILPYRFPPGFGLFGLLSWHSPALVPLVWMMRCGKRNYAAALRPGTAEEDGKVMCWVGCEFTQEKLLGNTSPVPGAALVQCCLRSHSAANSWGRKDIGLVGMFVLLLSLMCLLSGTVREKVLGYASLCSAAAWPVLWSQTNLVLINSFKDLWQDQELNSYFLEYLCPFHSYKIVLLSAANCSQFFGFCFCFEGKKVFHSTW